MITSTVHLSSNQPHTFNTNWFCKLMKISAKKVSIRGEGNSRVSRMERAIEGKDYATINVMYPFSKRRFIVVLSRLVPNLMDIPGINMQGDHVNWYVAAYHNNDFYETIWFCNLIGVKSAPRKAHVELNIPPQTWFAINVQYYSTREAYSSPTDRLTFYCKAIEIPY